MSGSVARNTLYLTIASVGQKILAFVFFLLIARIMMPENTGAYFLALSITTIFAVLTDFGISPVLIRDIAKRPDEALALIRGGLGLKFPLLILAAFAANLAAWLLDYEILIRQLVGLATVVMIADAFSLFYYGVLRGFQNLRYESLGIFVGQLITVVIGGVVLFTMPSLYYLIIALIAGSIFNMVYSGVHVYQQLGPKSFSPNFDKKKSWQLLKIALPFALAAIFVKVYSNIDTIFLSKYIGNIAVGIYAVAYKFTYAFQFIPLAFVAALYPGMSALVGKDSKRLSELFTDSMWYMMILATPITFGIWAIAPDLVLLAGPEYLKAAQVLQVLVLVLIPIFLDFPIGSLLNAADRQITKTSIMGCTMVVNIVLNLILIPKIGIMGAPYASLGSFVFMFLVGLYFVPQIVKNYRFSDLINTTVPILVSGLVMAAIAYYLRPLIGFILTIPVAAVVYVLMLIITKSLKRHHYQGAIRLLKHKSYASDTPHDA